MKRLMAALLAALALFSVAFAAEPVDLTTYTDAELDALRVQVAEEIRARAAAKAPENPAADFRYVSNGREVRIVEYIGNSGNVYIPDEIDGVPVTQIFDDLFNGSVNVDFDALLNGSELGLHSIRLPAKLVSIGEDAFHSTFFLEHELVMPKTQKSIEMCAFWSSSIPGLVLQSDCELSQYAFAYSELKFCYIREGAAVELGPAVFTDTPMEVAVIPADVTQISSSVFDSCNNLTVYCPAGSYAEQYCKENFIVCDTANYEAMVAYYEALYPAE